MNEKAVQAIQHVTTATLADDSETAVGEFDKAGELIDELVEERLGGSEEDEDGNDVKDEESDDGASEDDDPEEEDGGVRAKAGEKIRTVKENVPTPDSPLALAGLGAAVALAGFSAVRALSRRGEE
jgi:hypothetical protein